MTELIDLLPKDQQALILERLGPTKVAEIAKTISPDEIEVHRKGSHVKGVSLPITRFYWACLRAMGPLVQGTAFTTTPNPAMAWLEVLKLRYDTQPTFTHPKISEAVSYYGGWKQMWTEFNTLDEKAARNRFIMAYKEITGQ